MTSEITFFLIFNAQQRFGVRVNKLRNSGVQSSNFISKLHCYFHDIYLLFILSRQLLARPNFSMYWDGKHQNVTIVCICVSTRSSVLLRLRVITVSQALGHHCCSGSSLLLRFRVITVAQAQTLGHQCYSGSGSRSSVLLRL